MTFVIPLMSQVTRGDWEMLLDCVSALYEIERLEAFPRAALIQALRLVPADSGTFNYLAPSVPKVVTAADPVLPDQDKRTERFAQYLPQHPVLSHYLRTGDPRASKVSDFLTERQYHELQLYQEFYREIRYEDQLSFFLFPPGAELIGISFARDRRSFTERDRDVLNLLRPHVARAYQRLERMDLAKRNLEARPEAELAARVTSVVLDAKDRPVEFGPDAELWIKLFFPGRVRKASLLPGPITEWLRRSRVADLHHIQPFVCDRAGQRLVLSVFATPDGERMLILTLQILSNKAGSWMRNGLTPREIDVLLHVEQGKSNIEVAAALGISPLTVRCHLEHIFEKLKVSSRTAAVSRFRVVSACSDEAF